MINNLTATEQFSIIAQVLAKVICNFWPAILLVVVCGVILAQLEGRAE